MLVRRSARLVQKPAHSIIVEKSRAACIAAVETYNRATSPYREETFAILMINAWELLLKARVLKENGGKRSSIYEYEPRKNKKGLARRQVVKRTKSHAPYTISITRACSLCAGFAQDKVDVACIENINALLEIRDVATHFVNKPSVLTKRLSEISLAAVKNYVLASQKWFGVRYADLNIASIPLSFHLDQMEVEAVAKRTPAEVTRFLAHLAKMEVEANGAVPNSEYSFSVRVEFDLVKKKAPGAMTVTIVGEGGDLKINLDEDRIPEAFPWNYGTLSKRLTNRYSNFKQNDKYHTIRKALETNKALCYVRQLDPKNKRSAKTRFYNPNIVPHFDKHYELKVAGKASPSI